jgi:undecaprenyl diphosphate synthase
MATAERPEHIGIIMDGNRRWAKAKGVPQLEGHRAGYEKLKDVLSWCKEYGISHLTVYAFSTENWNRTKEEVAYLLDLFRVVMREQLKNAMKEKIRLRFPGDRSRFPDDIRKAIEDAEEKTAGFSGRTFSVALSYGGRAEILDAVHRIPPEHLESITEEEFGAMLWSSGIPDPDMIIRTSGEHRLSGFLTWGSVYSELFFTDTYWPAFTKEEFVRMLDRYGERERRFGK